MTRSAPLAVWLSLGLAACGSARDAPSDTPPAAQPFASAPSTAASDGAAPSAPPTSEPAASPPAAALNEAPSSATAPPEATAPTTRAPDSQGPVAPAAETPTVTPSSAPVFHAFLLLGQSNMAGYPKAQPEDRAEDPRVRVLGFDDCAATGRQTDQWDTAAPPLHECWNDGLGPGDYFAKTLLTVIPEADSIGLIPCAISGERIETFLKVGGARYDYILNRARIAQQAGGVIEGILFHQGESNSGDPSWPGKVATLVSDLRTDLRLGEIPFLAGELLYTGGTAGHNSLVRQLPDVIGNARVISASGLLVDPTDTRWNLHFSRDAQVELGKRYAQTLIEALGW